MKAKLNIKRVVVCLVIFLGIIAGVTCLLLKKKGNNADKKNNPSTVYTGDVHQGTYIDILTEDCSLYVGTVITLRCKANPENMLDNLTWTSSDEEIAVIDNNGKLTVVGTGTTIITVSNELLTDSIIVIGIEKEESAGENETVTEPMLPILIPDINGGLVPERPTNKEEQGKPDENETKPAETEAATENPSKEDHITSENTEAETKPEVVPETRPETDAEPETTEDVINYQELIISSIASLGYSRYKQDYIYIYEEDGNYLGEVIVNDSFLQIYIQTRTTGFDEALKSLIALIIPEEYESVYSAFAGAEDNKTIKVQNHTIRIRPATGDNHAQLIISY